ncbi:hypothetical protein TRFO_06552 [Tritrichomonas foetus]|uniref:Right handed beta helix domain-containing protein n=1 Tax=Tritrichomonas foetus TaxID=1144522 RepID=A0A1J4JYE9_9EUKA|nr:hypothetical protein TRFO_06552 [Tritrichomonas foetus]|eukprot:OHT03722.1 hypothetical protein TRFO_06552 [Tritrichomonas foetus]
MNLLNLLPPDTINLIAPLNGNTPTNSQNSNNSSFFQNVLSSTMNTNNPLSTQSRHYSDATAAILSKNISAPLNLTFPPDLVDVMNFISIPTQSRDNPLQSLQIDDVSSPFTFSENLDFEVLDTLVFDLSQHQSLQDLINEAKPKTKIIIPQGSYDEFLIIPEKELYILGNGDVTFNGFESQSKLLIIESVNFQQSSTGRGGVSIISGSTKLLKSTVSAVKQTAVFCTSNSRGDFSNCVLHAINHPCVFSNKDSSVRCIDCIIERSLFLGVLAAEKSQIQLVSCTVTNNQQGGILVSGSASINVEKSKISSNEKKGIEVVSQGIIYIKDTTFENYRSGQAFFITGGTQATIKGCTFSNCKSTCIQASNAASIISHRNTYKDSITSLMIMLTNTAAFNSKHDEITGTTQAGIACINGGQAFIKKMRAHDLSGTALYASGDFSLMCCENSTIESVEDISVQIGEGGRAEFIDVTISNSADPGFVLIDDATGAFDGVKVTNGKDSAGTIKNVTNFNFKNCTFTNNAVFGLLLNVNSTPTFEQCSVINNGQVGLEINSSNPTLTNCTISKHTDIGLSLNDGSVPTIIGGSVTENEQGGIVCNGASPTIKNVFIGNNGNAGISGFAGSQPVLDHCTIKGNQIVGCQVTTPKTIIRFNNTSFEDHTRSCAIVAIDEGSAICTQCVFRNSKISHLEIRKGAAVALSQCDLTGAMSGIGVQVHNNGYFHMIQSIIHEETRTGLLIGGAGHAEIISSTFLKCNDLAVSTLEESTTVIQNSLFDGGEIGNCGLQICAGTVTISNTVFKNLQQGIVKANPAILNHNQVSFENNSKDFIEI